MAFTRDKLRRRGNYLRALGKYDSKFEETLHGTVLSVCEFHPKERIAYTVTHKYSPDFIYRCGEQTFIIESKGRFAETAEATKYLRIRENLPEGYELVFLFQNPLLSMPRAKKKKDGTRTNHANWAEKHDFRWFDKDSIKEILV
jgi:hypothetical protein